MSFVDRNKYLGTFTKDYKNTNPQIGVSFQGMYNTAGSKKGWRSGQVGYCVQFVPENLTYDQLSTPNFIIGVRVLEASQNSGYIYTTDISCNTARGYFIGSPQGAVQENIQDMTNKTFSTRLKTPPSALVGRYYCDIWKFEYIGDTGAIQWTGTTTPFWLEITANCPIIRLNVDNKFLDINGNYEPLTVKTTIDLVDPDWILNSMIKDKDNDKKKWYLYNTWQNGTQKISKNLEINSIVNSSLCLLADQNNTGDLDTRLYYNANEPFMSGRFSGSNNVWGELDVKNIPDLSKTYTYYSKGSVFVTNFSTNIPIFKNITDINGYLSECQKNDGDPDQYIRDHAINADDIIDKGDVDIGDMILDTPLNDGYSRNAFNKMFALDYSGIAELTSNIFNTDTSISNALIDGLKLYGANPIDCIIDLSYYPFDVKKLVPHTIQHNIMFGSYYMTFNADIGLIQYPRVIIDCGSSIYIPGFNDFRDFEPYSQLFIYLPYVGTYKLDISQYYKKNINIKYILDLVSGTCIVVLMADNIIIDSFEGNLSIKQSISSIDYNAYSQAIATNVASSIKSIASSLVPIGGILDDTKNVALGSINDLVDFTAKNFDNMQSINSQRITIRGASSPSANMCMPQYPFLYCVKNEQSRPQNEREIVGYPSNTGGKVKNFKGFLKCKKVSMQNCNLTIEEKKEIYQLLQNGIYI